MEELQPFIKAKEDIKNQIIDPYITGKQRAKLYLKIKLINNMIELISITKSLN
ncbi:hypothetical protein [Ammoniphilus sp. 3BR4]|uniref:hypothetical protein n=1 Tax=Ammoniphilus sp. 3BR4 TaxID=3158265 RepID=UPI00346620B2